MHSMPYLIQNSALVWCVQRKVPLRLQAAGARLLGSKKPTQVYLKKSLGTKDRREATRRAGAPSGVTAEAFRVDDDGISTNWIEFSGGFPQVCALFKTLRTVRKTHMVGVLAVNDVENIGVQYKKCLHSIH